MKRIWILFLILITFSCGNDKLISIKCNSECYTGPPNTLNVGTCKAGKTVCDDQQNIIGCKEQILPKTRTCTITEDVTCDHFTSLLKDVTLDHLCGTFVANSPCHPGTVKCINHELVCQDEGKPEEESCLPAGYDHNCDGVPNNIKSKLCYDGDPMDLIVPDTSCRAGITKCLSGQEICYGEKYPMGNRQNVDIVILANGSWDFNYQIRGIKQILITFAHINNSSFFHYGVVEFPGNGIDLNNLYQIDLNMSLASVFISRLPNLLQAGGIDLEYPFDAIVAIANNTLNLNFREDSKKFIIVFADDNDCPFRPYSECQDNSKSKDDVLEAIQGKDIRILVFAEPMYAIDWLQIVATSNGGFFDIDQKEKILDILISMLGNQCE